MLLRIVSVANRIVSVGSLDRAKLLAQMLDAPVATHTSARGFSVFTGERQGVAISVIATGMVRSQSLHWARKDPIYWLVHSEAQRH